MTSNPANQRLPALRMAIAAGSLLAVTLLVHAANWFRPGWSGTEGLRVLVAHSMVASGDWLVPNLGGETLLTKPPLFYWLLALLERSVGIHEWSARLPALLSIWWCACVALGTVGRLADRRAGWFAAIGVVLAPSVVWHGAFAEIDPLFMSLTAISVIWLAEGGVTAHRLRLAMAGTTGALALLTKGPPYLMFAAFPLIFAWRRSGLAVAVAFLPALLLPIGAFGWLFLGAVQDATATGDAAAVAANETIGRLGSFDWNSVIDLPLHLLRTVAATLPFTPFALAALRSRETTGIARVERDVTWALVAATCVLAVFPMRPPRYLLPGVPLVAIAAARRLSSWTAVAAPPPRALARSMLGLSIVGAIACFVVPWLATPFVTRTSIGAMLLAIGAPMLRTRTAQIAGLALVPALLVATVQSDRNELREHGLRDERSIAAILRSELSARGVERFEFWGNPGETLALHLDPDARWRDRLSREVTSDWVIARWYDGQVRDLDPAAWVDRVAVRGQDRVFVIAQRRR